MNIHLMPWIGAACLAATLSSAETTCDLPPPQGPVVLELAALRAGTDRPQVLFALDRAGLAALPETVVTTATIWTEGPQEFGGPRLDDLLRCFGSDAHRFELHALNGYVIEIGPEVDTLARRGGLVAMARNGSPLTRRSKGPLWLVFPYDDDPAYRSETIYALSIWQLARVVALPE